MSGNFDPEWYLKEYPDVSALGMDPWEHYQWIGGLLGRRRNGYDSLEQKRTGTIVPAISSGNAEFETRRKRLSALFPEPVQASVFYKQVTGLLSAAMSDDVCAALAASEEALEKAAADISNLRERPLVSVITPTFNRADVIGGAIQSVLDQHYQHWELLVCDDASTDATEGIVSKFGDSRIRYLKLPKSGAAAARNVGLAKARGEIIAYLDSDNFWHPRFLTRMVQALLAQSGHSAAYANYIDFSVAPRGDVKIRSFARPAFHHEKLLEKNFIDLNAFVHRRELYDCFGGFNDSLTRRQDYDLIIKYTWLRDPIKVDEIVALYQRNSDLRQITTEAAHDDSCVEIINGSIERYLKSGLPRAVERPVKSVTIISWDLCRNHFSKPFALAEALSKEYDVQLISFRFFEEEMFPPLRDVKPSFETVYLAGGKFPEFFEQMDRAAAEVRGDVIYVVKPRLPSLGVAMLAHLRSKAPIILEINDLETVVSDPKRADRHKTETFDTIDLTDKDLLNPYSDLWSRVLDPIAKQLPVLLTHNKGLDAHFDGRCLYMRNLKDEAVYDPARFDRGAVRADLGFSKDDRVILFGGLIRRHKGVYELVELVQRLSDERYKLLFVGSRPTPDQKKLVEKFGNRIRVLPPQDREAMARINLAADLVVLWLDPEVPASHYQMPYKATDAIAMGTAIIANDISDLGEIGRQEYLAVVPFGNWKEMTSTIQAQFNDSELRNRRQAAVRRLFLRQFSYAAARSNFELAARRSLANAQAVRPIAEKFAQEFSKFRKTIKRQNILVSSPGFCSEPAASSGLLNQPCRMASADRSIEIVDVKALPSFNYRNLDGILVIMPSIDTEKALNTARLLVQRAGIPVRIIIIEDTSRQGFIKTLNAAAARSEVRYIVYLAEDAFPGVDWLKIAWQELERSGKGLLAFNCGKWRGRIAAFGMVRTEWIQGLYGGPIFFEGYKSHRADNEITVIARAADQFVYCSDASLIEVDPIKVFRGEEFEASNFTVEDKKLFKRRFNSGFGGLIEEAKLNQFRDEYLNQRVLLSKLDLGIVGPDRSRGGYLTVATGHPRYFQMACNLARSIKIKDPSRPICLAHSEPLLLDRGERQLFDDFVRIDDGASVGVEHKLNVYALSPYHRTMFVDADIILMKSSIERIWQKLKGYKFTFAGSIRRGGEWRIDIGRALGLLNLDWCASGNLGVFYFEKDPETAKFFAYARELLSHGSAFSVAHTGGRGLSIEPILGLSCGRFGFKPYPIKDADGDEWHLTVLKGDCFRFDHSIGQSTFKKSGQVVEPIFVHFPGLKLDINSKKSRIYKGLVNQLLAATPLTSSIGSAQNAI